MKYNKISIALKDNREISVYLSPDEARDLLDQFYEVFSGGLTEKANFYYKLFINWTNEKIKKTFIKKNMFDFTHIQKFETKSIKTD